MTVDIVVLGVVLLFAVLGAFSGLVLQVFRMLAALAAAYLAWTQSARLAALFPGFLERHEAYRQFFFTTVLFVVLLLVLGLLTKLVLRLFWKPGSPLRPLDRLFGALLGAFKGAILMGFILAALLLAQQSGGLRLRGVDMENSLSVKLVRRYGPELLGKLRAANLLPLRQGEESTGDEARKSTDGGP